ncbi:Radical SAM domain protein [Gloeothece citriformis PCC 7424]|uniref:Radical SAM domain protein n=1 Tax=Gloeothece citriformis (strain PCC 7424) TaxID=65393 RepID=B7K8F8_GLOC7|nr:radical SAM protein [Gloeothece citriformis]ACK69918.1 Radical SAM domain protein [Gloeothece citriformis PCC 7424]
MYKLSKNKIITNRYCEINVVHHCNLSCRACSHLAPTLPKYFVDPDQIYQDLSILSKVYLPRGVKLVGGEPLLHPNILEVIEAIRTSQISNFVKLVTNGHLLTKVPELFWEKIDAVDISMYPNQSLNSDTIKELKQRAKLHNTILQTYYWDNFRESYSELGTKNKNLTKRIYSSCALAHIWRVHTISEGYFYKCPQSLFIPKVIQKGSLQKDGLKIDDSPNFLEKLLAYLTSKDPLESCSNCLGCVGKLIPHEQINPKQWRSKQEVPTEELIDLDYLNFLEKQPYKARGTYRELSLPTKINHKITEIFNNYQP